MTVAHQRLKVKVMGQAIAVGPTSVEVWAYLEGDRGPFFHHPIIFFRTSFFCSI